VKITVAAFEALYTIHFIPQVVPLLHDEATFIKGKDFESERIRASIARHIQEVNRIIELEHANSQLLINPVEALERKGIKPQIPQTESFRSAASRFLGLQAEAVKGLGEMCTVQ